jgi:hypothetical protein
MISTYQSSPRKQEGDIRSTPLTHSDSLSSLVSIARASILLVLWREAMIAVPTAFSLSGSLTTHQPRPYASLGKHTILHRRSQEIDRTPLELLNMVFYSSASLQPMVGESLRSVFKILCLSSASGDESPVEGILTRGRSFWISNDLFLASSSASTSTAWTISPGVTPLR